MKYAAIIAALLLIASLIFLATTEPAKPSPEEAALPVYQVEQVGVIGRYSNHHKLYTIDINGTKYYVTFGAHGLPAIGPKVEQ